MKLVLFLIIILSALQMRSVGAGLDQSFEVTVTPITPMINSQMIEGTTYYFQIKAKNIDCNLRAGDQIPEDTTTFLGKMSVLVSFQLNEVTIYQAGYVSGSYPRIILYNETYVEMDYPSIGYESTAIFTLTYSSSVNDGYIDPRHLMEYQINFNLGLLSQATQQGSEGLQIIITYIHPFVGHTFSKYNVISQDKINFQTSYLQDIEPLITKMQSTDSKYGLDTLLNYQKAVTSGDYKGADDIIWTPDLYYQRTLFEYLDDEAQRISTLKTMQQTIDANKIEKENIIKEYETKISEKTTTITQLTESLTTANTIKQTTLDELQAVRGSLPYYIGGTAALALVIGLLIGMRVLKKPT